MNREFIFGLAAFASLLPSAVFALKQGGISRGADGRSVSYWLTLGVAVCGPLAWAVVQSSGTWHTGLSITLWVTIAAAMVMFAMVVLLNPSAWRLTPLMTPYMALLAVLALIWRHAPETRPLLSDALGGDPSAWVDAHILVSVATYALVTIAAVAALGALLQEKALKNKRPTALSRLLPSVSESEWLLVRLLALGEIVLALGMATGMATQYRETGGLIVWDHKTILSVTAFVVIAALLLAHFVSGVRGRLVTRIVLIAYLLLSLGYPGVKFVTDVLIGQ
ncbi:MAG TPA: hypothetical protein ENI69_10780 [Rhodospirillales bacterium]|nr:hypothetical protein [Rhodospirillales bacterium]